MDKEKCCGTCLWFDGSSGDGYQFCDEKEIDVSEYGYCYKYRDKEQTIE